MMKRIKSLIILAVILVIVIIGYAVATTIAKREEADDTEAEITTYTINDRETADVSSVLYTGPSSSLGIECSGDKYYLAGDHAFPLDQATALSIVEAVVGISAKNAIETPENLDDFGLESPEKSVEVKFTDGSRTVYLLGDYNKYSSSYYLMIEGTGTVYSVDGGFTDNFDYSLDDLIVNDTVTKPTNGLADVTKISIDRKDGTGYEYRFVDGVEEVTDEDGNIITEGVDYSFAKYDKEGKLVLENAVDEAKNIYSQVVSSSYVDWIDYDINDEKLEKYGLKEPEVMVTLTYTATVTSTSDDTSSTVTKEVEKTIVLNIGSVLPRITDDTETAGESTAEIADTTADTAADTSEDTAEAQGDDSDPDEEPADDRYVMLGDGKIVYILSEDSLYQILAD